MLTGTPSPCAGYGCPAAASLAPAHSHSLVMVPHRLRLSHAGGAAAQPASSTAPDASSGRTGPPC